MDAAKDKSYKMTNNSSTMRQTQMALSVAVFFGAAAQEFGLALHLQDGLLRFREEPLASSL